MSFDTADYQLHWDAATAALGNALEILLEDEENRSLVDSLSLEAISGVPLVKVHKTTLVRMEAYSGGEFRLMLAKNYDCWGSESAEPVYGDVPVRSLEELYMALDGWWVVAGADLPVSADTQSIHPWLIKHLVSRGFVRDERPEEDPEEHKGNPSDAVFGHPMIMIVNGQEERVDADPGLPLGTALEEVLRKTKTRRRKGWEIRNEEGVLLDPEVLVDDYDFARDVTLHVNLPVGSNG